MDEELEDALVTTDEDEETTEDVLEEEADAVDAELEVGGALLLEDCVLAIEVEVDVLELLFTVTR